MEKQYKLWEFFWIIGGDITPLETGEFGAWTNCIQIPEWAWKKTMKN
jgi:hypothetical protein